MNIYKSDAGRLAVEECYRRALRQWPVAHRHLVVPTRHGDTFVIASGDEGAPPVVLFHGSGANSSVWMRDVAEWSRHHRVYAVDMIGEPGLSAPSRPPLASDAYAAWLDDVWAALDLRTASIVGVSLGGWLGIDYAVRRPDHVASLSLMCPSGIGAANFGVMLKAGFLLALGPWGVRKALTMISGRTTLPTEVSEFVRVIFRHFRPRMEKVPRRSDKELGSLSMPVQVIVGGRDALIRSGETRARMQRLVPHAQVMYLDDEGHFLPPQTATVARFLNDVWGTNDGTRADADVRPRVLMASI